MKIILFENTYSVNSKIRNLLVSKGHSIEHYESITDCININSTIEYDCIIFNIDDSGEKNFDYLKTNKATATMEKILPIIADDDIETLKNLFSLGYNHYIKKPYTLNELELHLNRIHTSYKAKMPLSLCTYSFNVKACTLLYDNKHYIFTKNEASLINLLISKKNAIVTSSEISLSLWKNDVYSHTTIRSLISKTKKKLPKQFIKNYRGVGYMWVDIPDR